MTAPSPSALIAPATASAVKVCTRTGLTLCRANGQRIHRVAKKSYGALQPQLRGDEPLPQWGRWDVRHHRTAYAATDPRGAFAETLASFRRSLGAGAPFPVDLSDYLDDLTGDGFAEVTKDWQDRGHMLPNYLPRGWREERDLYELKLPGEGWFIDVETPESMKVLGERLGPLLQAAGVAALDVSVLRGGNRAATSAIASWMWPLVLDDGSLPLGIHYLSRHSQWECWAFWLRAVDDGGHRARELVQQIRSRSIACDDPDLLYVADLFGIKCW